MTTSTGSLAMLGSRASSWTSSRAGRRHISRTGSATPNANFGQSRHGVFTDRPETLTNDFFVNLLDMSTEWEVFGLIRERVRRPGSCDGPGHLTGSAVDLVFGSNSQLRGISEIYACDDAKDQTVRDFLAAWDKLMNLDCFDPRLIRHPVGRSSNSVTSWFDLGESRRLPLDDWMDPMRDICP